jgi:hypothetical protein
MVPTAELEGVTTYLLYGSHCISELERELHILMFPMVLNVELEWRTHTCYVAPTVVLERGTHTYYLVPTVEPERVGQLGADV